MTVSGNLTGEAKTIRLDSIHIGTKDLCWIGFWNRKNSKVDNSSVNQKSWSWSCAWVWLLPVQMKSLFSCQDKAGIRTRYRLCRLHEMLNLYLSRLVRDSICAQCCSGLVWLDFYLGVCWLLAVWLFLLRSSSANIGKMTWPCYIYLVGFFPWPLEANLFF